MMKRSQGRRRFVRRNFKQRYFRLTTQSLSYAKTKSKNSICDIPLSDILAVEKLHERSFKLQNIFQVKNRIPPTLIICSILLNFYEIKIGLIGSFVLQIIRKDRILYVKTANCVEEKEWVDLLSKICQSNVSRLDSFHPSAFISGEWTW